MKSTGFKKLARGTNFFVLAVLAAGILICINALSYRHFFRVDLTATKKYTVSEATKKAVGELDDIVNIKVYLSRRLPPYMAPLVDQVKDMLEEYRICANGNLDIEYIDPADDPPVQQKLQFMGIPQLQLNIVEKDQAAVTTVYMGLAVFYGDSKEVIPALTDVASLEYELTGKILRVLKKEVKTIGFLSGHGEPGLDRELGTVNNELREQYYTRTVSTAGNQTIPAEVAVLVVASPKQLTERELFAIDQYLMAGGKAVFLVDSIDIQERGMQGAPSESPVLKLLEHYGVRVAPELVLDQLSENASFRSGPYDVLLPYPFWVRVVRQSTQTDNPIVSGIEAMVLPWASPLELLQEKTGSRTVSVLARSSPSSWTMKGYFDLSPRQDFSAPENQTAQHVLALAMSGSFSSYFDGKPVPAPDKDAAIEEPSAPKGAEKKAEPPAFIQKSPETRIIVTGNSRFITDNFITQFDGNRAFFLNAVDWCTADDRLMGIRARESGDSTLYVMSDNLKAAVRLLNMCAVPVLVAVFGIVHAYIRRRRKRLAVKELR
ncbi:MAG: GldG family protein [Deltaproteobacteria bacterium]|nr:GldG family protein [Deltaproteobacteria bacterium]